MLQLPIAEQHTSPLSSHESKLESFAMELKETYESQEALIRRKARDCEDGKEIELSLNNNIDDLNERYPDRSVAWRLARAEYLVWERFCKLSYPPVII
jgi:hypothetical protein